MNPSGDIAGGAEGPLRRFYDEVVHRGDFTHDWFGQHASTLEPLLEELDGRPARMLEIGSFEGLSSCYFLWRLPHLRLTCIDTFAGSPGLPSSERSGMEAAFDRNVALVDASRVEKRVGDSHLLLLDLARAGARFELVYVDGSHRALDVLVDAALAWPLLEVGGVVVFDDYRWSLLGDDPMERPGPAIDAFLTLVDGHAEVLFRARQVAARKLSNGL